MRLDRTHARARSLASSRTRSLAHSLTRSLARIGCRAHRPRDRGIPDRIPRIAATRPHPAAPSDRAPGRLSFCAQCRTTCDWSGGCSTPVNIRHSLSCISDRQTHQQSCGHKNPGRCKNAGPDSLVRTSCRAHRPSDRGIRSRIPRIAAKRPRPTALPLAVKTLARNAGLPVTGVADAPLPLTSVTGSPAFRTGGHANRHPGTKKSGPRENARARLVTNLADYLLTSARRVGLLA